ncbi:MAG: CRTAC1 family protein [bacterium]
MQTARASWDGVTRPTGGLAWAAGVAGILCAAAAQAAFVDVTNSATDLITPGVTYGSAWGDFNGDGYPDCLVCRHYERPVLYRNLGNGHLSCIFNPPLFDPPLDHHGPLVADLDGDGDLDIYLTQGADAGFGDTVKKLYRNDGNFAFVNVSQDCGVADLYGRGRSSSAMDVDGDGDVDFFVAKAPRSVAPNSLFLNDGTGHFTDVAAQAGLADAFGSVGGIWGDYDNDGDPDLLIGGEEEATYETRMYRNDGNATFTNVTQQSLGGVGQISAAAFGDFDNDGDLDLAIGLGDPALFDAVAWTPDSLRYFFNTRYGDNGLDGLGFLQTGDSARYDISLNGYFIPSTIFISGSAFHPEYSPFTMPFEIFGIPDFDPGQTLATYLWTEPAFGVWEVRCNAPPAEANTFAGVITLPNGHFTDVSPVATEPYTHGPRGTRLWRNDGRWFVDISAQVGLTDSVNVHFLQWVDLDQDGRLDLYVENKGDTQTLNAPNRFYRNLGGTFEDDTAAQNLAGPTSGLGDSFSFEDYDLDGDLDLVETCGTGPRFLAYLDHVHFYRNDGPVGHRLRVKLQGIWSTRDGYGAWVTCVSATAGRQVRYVTGNAWRGGQTMLDPYFGLGADTVVDTLRVDWPSGSWNVLVDVPAGVVQVVERDPSLVGAPVAASAPGVLKLVATPNPAAGDIVFVANGRVRDQAARLTVWDAAGRRLLDRRLAPGESRVSWNGRDSRGRAVASGVYFARLTEGTRRADAKVVHLAR